MTITNSYCKECKRDENIEQFTFVASDKGYENIEFCARCGTARNKEKENEGQNMNKFHTALKALIADADSIYSLEATIVYKDASKACYSFDLSDCDD